MGKGGQWLMVVTLSAVIVMVQTQECSSIVPLAECNEDHGPYEPQDGQAVYLGSDYGEGWWRYPSSDGWVYHYEHNIRTIMETEDSWAKWIYHDCRDNYVCLESGKYPNYYFYSTNLGYQGISYSSAPQTEDWTKLKVVSKWRSSRGYYMFFVSERYYRDGYRLGLPVHVHIPNRCEGFRKVIDYINRSPVSIDYTYTYERGITRTDTSSVSTTITNEISMEVASGIITASRSGSFSMTWTNERSTELTETQEHESNINIPQGKRLIIWQKVATYGPYEWRSGVFFITCMTDG